jgi:hypothetical protein
MHLSAMYVRGLGRSFEYNIKALHSAAEAAGDGMNRDGR